MSFEIQVEIDGQITRYVVETRFVLGRSPGCDAPIANARLSRQHAQLTVIDDSLWVTDLGTANGTRKNGERITEPTRLDPGDEIELCDGVYVRLGARAVRRGTRLDARLDPTPPPPPMTTRGAHRHDDDTDDGNDDADSDERPSVAAKPPARVEVIDAAELARARDHIRLGRRFVFIDDADALKQPGRMARLFGHKQRKGRVVRALHGTVEVAGARIVAEDLELPRLASLVTDRDLYRAERDTARLIVAMPGGGRAKVKVTMNGAPLTERDVDLSRGVAIEPLSMLLSGSYQAQLFVDDTEVGEPRPFTVAQFTLAPLSARLAAHEIDRSRNELSLTLLVDSYGVPFDRELQGTLLERGAPVGTVSITHQGEGRYLGKARLSGAGPFSVRLTAAGDASRTADVALPGTRKAERKLTLVSELGKEIKLSLVAEPRAIPTRGAFLTEGDFLATPVVIDDVIADRATLRANEDLEGLCALVYEPSKDSFTVHELGDVKREQTVEVPVAAPMAVVFVGCFVHGEPFEAFSTVFAAEKAEQKLTLQAPSSVLPGEELAITVRTGRAGKIPVVLRVRDERLVATDTPEKALAAAMKRIIEAASADLKADDFRFLHLDELSPPELPPSYGFLIVLTERGGRTQRLMFDQAEVTIGRTSDNDIVLAKGNVSKRHTRIVRRDGQFIVLDLKSTNGTFVNGKFLTAPQVLRTNDVVYVGDFALRLVAGTAQPIRRDGGDGFWREDRAVLRSMPPGRPSAAARGRAPIPEVEPVDVDFDMASAEGFAEEDAGGEEVEDAAPAAAAPARMSVKAVRESAAEITGSIAVKDLERAAPVGALTNVLAGAERKLEQREEEVRTSFPEVLFCAVVECSDGEVVKVRTADSLGGFVIDGFFVDGGDFGEVQAHVQIEKPVRVDFDLAPEIHKDDRVVGTLRVGALSGSARVKLSRDGKPVALRTADGAALRGDTVSSGVELSFDAGPGLWRAEAEDAEGQRDAVEVRVGEPGVYRSLVREVRLLDKGSTLLLDGDMQSLRVLPGIDEPFQMLCEATAGYGHMCCEQTAAKLLSAVTMFLTTDDKQLRTKAEEIVLAGIARERSMWRRGRGFSMYPDQRDISDYYTPKVVRYLWSLDGLSQLRGLSARLKQAVEEGLEMADDVARGVRIERVPHVIRSVEDAHAAALAGDKKQQRAALELVSRMVAVDDEGARVKEHSHRVAERCTLSYAAATLFALGKGQLAMKLANEVLKQLNDEGRLYSTVDSVAAIALMIQLKKSGVVSGGAEVVVNGKKMASALAAELSDQVESIEVREGVAVVEVVRLVEHRWAEARAAAPVKVGFHDARGRSQSRFVRGDKAELVVALPKGYVEGDLVYVCLPSSLSWLQSGGRVKRFTVDFEGKTEVRVPVVVTHAIQGKQRFAVAVRNMFEEERVSSPGLLTIDAA